MTKKQTRLHINKSPKPSTKPLKKEGNVFDKIFKEIIEKIFRPLVEERFD